MATRSTVHFVDEYETVIIYVHHDGMPQRRGKQIETFLERMRGLPYGAGVRGQACETSAQFVAFMFEEYQRDLTIEGRTRDPLETISIKIVSDDPGDIEYRYTVKNGVAYLDDLSGPRVRERQPLLAVLARK